MHYLTNLKVGTSVLMLFFSLACLTTGCASIQVNERLAEYKALLDPLLGSATKEDMAIQFGMPTKREQLGSLEVWHYHQSFGTRGGATAYTPNPYNPYGTSTYAAGRAHEVYDSVTLMFDEQGILKNWRAYVQR